MLNFIKRLFRLLWKSVASILLIAIAIITVTSVTPIYDFAESKKFDGADIYNPYRNLDTTICWKRANFHTHTRVEGIMNECDYWPDEVLEAYDSLGYDIVTFSNHNKKTTHPKGEEYQSNGYEHGYNLFKYHKLVFGATDVWHFDHLLPIFASQKQFQIEQLAKDADLVQINHPLRTPTLYKKQLEYLSGYKLVELDSGKSTENGYWDSALSAGHYCFGVANDDLHYPDRSYRIARRCNFLCTPSTRYKDILNTLNEGCFYSMRIPDYGDGDWSIKYARNKALPYIKSIGLQDSVVFIKLSEPASCIKMIGQEHTTLAEYADCDNATYTMKLSDSYVRITAYFPEGEVIYTNPFARYDASLQESPFKNELPKIDILLTIIFNLLLLALLMAEGYILHKIIKR